MRRRQSSVLAASAAIALATTLSADAATTKQISVQSFAFAPAHATTALGGAVRWINKDPITHTTTSKITGPVGWDSHLIAGKAFQKSLAGAGTYDYVCTIHFGMAGTVAVPVTLTSAGRKITVKVASVSAPAGYSYQPAVKLPGSSNFTLLPATTKTSVVFTATRAGAYSFRSSVKHGSLAGTAPSPAKAITVS